MAAAFPQLCAALQGLPSLQMFALHMADLTTPLLPSLLRSLSGCIDLTNLSFQSCSLTGVPEGIDLPPSLRVVRMDNNWHLNLGEWLPCLAALPHCHTVALQGIESLSGASVVDGGLGGAPALRVLLCSYFFKGRKALKAALAAERATRGLPPVFVSIFAEVHHEAPLWTPRVRYGPCTLLPSPQLKTSSSVLHYASARLPAPFE